MKTYSVLLTPDAVTDLTEIYGYIADRSGLPEVALAYIQKLRDKCESLAFAPSRGNKRDDIRQNLRVLALDKNAVAAFEVEERE